MRLCWAIGEIMRVCTNCNRRMKYEPFYKYYHCLKCGARIDLYPK